MKKQFPIRLSKVARERGRLLLTHSEIDTHPTDSVVSSGLFCITSPLDSMTWAIEISFFDIGKNTPLLNVGTAFEFLDLKLRSNFQHCPTSQ
jgi:hypothetical protein